MNKQLEIKVNNENKSLCSSCGGNCCKHMPGIVHPDEVVSINDLLDTGKYAIDWWEGDPREDRDDVGQSYYIRPKTKGSEEHLLDGSWGGECVFLTNKGCELSFNERPYDCRMLEPSSGDSCDTVGVEKQEMVVLWMEHNNTILDYIYSND